MDYLLNNCRNNNLITGLLNMQLLQAMAMLVVTKVLTFMMLMFRSKTYGAGGMSTLHHLLLPLLLTIKCGLRQKAFRFTLVCLRHITWLIDRQ